MTQQDLINFIWAIANKLRGPYRPPQYRRVMIPMTVLRRPGCVLEPTKDELLAHHAELKRRKLDDETPAALMRKAIVSTLSERDARADICMLGEVVR
jgi:type I restriction enzyme M protein